MRKLDKWMSLSALMAALLLSSMSAYAEDAEYAPPPQSSYDDCAGIQGLVCENPDENCIFEESQTCGRWDMMGTCQLPPVLCAREYAPVCGCDGQTYYNECVALRAGVSVESQGACTEVDEPGSSFADCAGIAGLVCEIRGESCIFEPSQNCGNADMMGTCQQPPDACTDDWQPVCGCDGHTYSNACYALAAGVSVDYEDACVHLSRR